MRYSERILVGLVLTMISIIALWYGSPARTGAAEPIPVMTWAFVMFFALGFIIGSMGLLGAEENYPAFLSGMVLYFMIGGLIAVFIYVTRDDIGGWTLYDADNPGFWAETVRAIAMWPLELVRRAELLGYQLM